MAETTNYEVFGRRVAIAQGYGSATPLSYPVNWDAYGRACSEAMGRQRPLPTFDQFALPNVGAAPVSGSRAETPGRQAAAPIADIHVNPRTVKEVRELVADGIISKAQGRVYLGLKPHWWSACIVREAQP